MMHPLRNPAVNLAVNHAVAATKDLMARETANLHMNSASASSFAMAPASSTSATLYKSSSSFKFFKYFVFSYMLLVLLVEILWAAYSTQGLRKDLQAHVENGEWEQTYLREFFKSTKNFFMFNLILIFLSICIGCTAVGTENRHLILAFIFVFSIEWFFEVIGVYNSKEKNVVIYRMIPALLRPGLIVSTLIFYRTVNRKQALLAREIEKEEANKPPTPPAAMRVIRPNQHMKLNKSRITSSSSTHGYSNPIPVESESSNVASGATTTTTPTTTTTANESSSSNNSSSSNSSNNNESPNVTVDENRETNANQEEEEQDANVVRISVE